MIGRVVRRLAGPLEPRLADAYRAFFFDVDAFASRIAASLQPRFVVEIGCGEGALLTALGRQLPTTSFVGVDVSPQVGRLFQGDRHRVSFAECRAEDLVGTHAGQADLVLICDVMHHAGPDDQAALWSAAAALVRPHTGRLILKEWIRTLSPIYGLGWASDRFITGDKVVYRTRQHWHDAATRAGWHVEAEWALRPWANNHALMLARRSSP